MRALLLLLPLQLLACGGGDDDDDGEALEIALTPSGTAYTNGTLEVTVEVVSGAPEVVELLRDGDVLETLSPPYGIAWDTTTEPEGTYELTARAAKGDDVATSEALEVVVDRTAPTVTQRIPGDVDGTIGEPLLVVFSEPVVLGGAVELTVTVGGADVGTGAPVLSADGTEMTVPLTDPLTVPSVVDVALSGGIADRAGNALVPEVWSFAVSWWSTVFPATAQGNFGADFALDSADRPVVAWRSADAGPFVELWDGRAWVTLAGGALDGAVLSPQQAPTAVTFDASDAPVVAWQNDPTADLSYDLFAARWDGATWQPLGDGPLDVAPQAATRGAALAVDPDGALTIVWAEDRADATGSELHLRRWNGTAWEDVAPALDAEGFAESRALFPPALEYAPDGAVVVAWTEQDGPGIGHVTHVARWDGAAWSVLDPITHGGGSNAVLGDLAVDSGGRPLVAFGDYNVVGQGFVWIWNDGSGWQQIGDSIGLGLEDGGGAASLVLDGDGRPVVGWGQGGEHPAPMVARWADGRWQPLATGAKEIVGDTALQSLVAVDRQDRVLVGFRELAPGDWQNQRFVLRRSNVGEEVPYGLETVAPTTCVIDVPEPPASIADTGCYADVVRRVPAPGLIPFSINSPLWSDGAYKRRFLVLPAGATIGFTATGAWQMPVGTILVKEFLIGPQRIPMETRFLVKRDEATWEGFSYLWSPDGSDATLLPPESSTADWSYEEGGQDVTHTHAYPSRAECVRCHNEPAGRVLGLQTAQLNRLLDYGAVGGLVDNQLRTLEHLGVFGGDVGAADPTGLARVAAPNDLAPAVEARVRAYLHANCAQCHLPGGERPTMDLRYDTPLADSNLCNDLTAGSSGTSNLWLRDGLRGPTQMPPLATLQVDDAWLALLGNWIDGLQTCP